MACKLQVSGALEVEENLLGFSRKGTTWSDLCFKKLIPTASKDRRERMEEDRLEGHDVGPDES
jgi:hypothetical protein